MICSKIVTNFKENTEQRTKLFNDLIKKGDILFVNYNLYFSSVDENFGLKQLQRLLKRDGFDNSYIEEYYIDSLPDSDTVVKSWVYNHLIKINTELYEINSQSAFREIADKLDQINQKALEIIKEDANNGRRD